MKNKFVKTIGVIGLAGFIFAFAGMIRVMAQEKDDNRQLLNRDSQSANSIVGVWEATVAPRNCATGAPAGPTFQSLVTFNKGGTMAEYGANPATPFRSSGQGVWQQGWTGEDSYYMRVVFFPLTPAGIPVGKMKVTQTVEHNRYTDQMETSGTFELTNPAGIVLATGCSTSTAVRFR